MWQQNNVFKGSLCWSLMLLGSFSACAQSETSVAVPLTTQSLMQRVSLPRGFQRVEAEPTSFAAWLRQLPVKPGRPKVRLFDGRLKSNQSAHFAVVDLDTGRRDLQQCADAAMRLRAEYLFHAKRGDAVAFKLTNGQSASWKKWRQGFRPKLANNRFSWRQSARADASYKQFRRYLNFIFAYAGTYSLERELISVNDPRQVQPGDIFIQGGFPGHAVVVLDVVENKRGERRFLLGQSNMPAQDFHILNHPSRRNAPWYSAKESGPLRTPEWTFAYGDLKRFSMGSAR